MTKKKQNADLSWGCLCGTGRSVAGCVAPFWRCDTAADGDSCCNTSSGRPADSAAVSLGTGAQQGRTLVDGAAVGHGPAVRTGQLHLQDEQRHGIAGDGQVFFLFFTKYVSEQYDVPPLCQLMPFPPGGTPEQEHGSTRHVTSCRLSQCSASCRRDVDGNEIRAHLWTRWNILRKETPCE